ncbi:MAG: phosphatidylglycerophosphatase A [Cycloclasticus sp.]|nr:phosphatidylglycerophosphatase A [Cycloclasticus sp.]
MSILKNNISPSFSDLLNSPVLMLAFGFGSGLSKKAPGTMGTVLAVILFYGLMLMGQVWYISGLVLVVFSGSWICGEASKKLGVHDHGGIVWDEVAGYLLTMYWAPFTLQNMLIGFILFRAFDILKPWPINWLDKHVSGGFGIMIDDILAGLMAAACLQGLLYII